MSHYRPQYAIAALLALTIAPSLQSQSNFTIIALPDTQYYSESHPQTFTAQTQWIVNNATALNIQAVLGLGDIVQTASNVTEWQNADASIKLLDNANIPYLLAVGNHDYTNSGDASGRTSELRNFNTYFGPSRYQKYSWYKGQYPAASNENFYGVLTINGKMYLFLMLEYYPRDESLAWASSVLAAYPTAEVIVVTHAYLYIDDTLVSTCDQSNAQSASVGADNNGDSLWSKFIREHNNISLVLNGHFTYSDSTGEAVAKRTDLGVNGNIVNQILSNYQEVANQNSGYLRILTFNPSANTISVESYSPTLNWYLTDQNNQFTVQWHSTGANPTGTGTVSGVVKDVSTCNTISGATASTTGASQSTNSSGSFSLSVPTPQQYTVSVQANSYFPVTSTLNAWTNFPEFSKYFLSNQQPGTITGNVTDQFGNPLSGATVWYSGGTTTTDANGKYTFSNVLVGNYTVTASANGYNTSAQSTTVSAGSTNTVAFTLTPVSGSIAGTVTNSSGVAIAGATVAYSGGSTVTDAHGNYTLSNVALGTYSVTASATGYQDSTQANVTVTANATTTVNFTLSIGTGQIYSISGAISPASIGSGTSVALSGPAPVLVQSASGAASSGSSSVTVAFGAASGTGDTILVFTRFGGTTISGVTDNPAGVASNTYTSVLGPTQWGVAPNPTDREAQVFVAKNITGGSKLTITVRFAAGSSHTVYVTAVEYSGADPTNPVNATAVGNGTVSANGAPATSNLTTTIANAKLVATSEDSNESYTSTGNGTGFTTDVAAGIRSISGGSGWPSLTEDMTAVAPQTWKATTSSAPSVVDWAIMLVALAPAPSQTVTGDSNGNYTFNNLNNGTYTITPSKPNVTFMPVSQSLTISGASVTGINFSAQGSTGTISGTVTNSGGSPISNAIVSYTGGSTSTATNGTYTLSNVPAGTVSVTASATGFQSSTQSVTVTANTTTTQNFTLSNAVGTISGTVTNSAGAAISGATVSYSGGSTTTSSTGTYTLSNVPVGTVSVTASATGFQSSTQSVTVTANTTTTQSFTLSNAVGTISGTVTNSSGTAISGATVSYSGGSTTTSSTGIYTLSNVPVGTVSVTASATGYVSSTQSVTVAANTTTTQNFTLSTSVGTITGTVKNSAGTAISGAIISYSGGSTTTASTGTYTLSNVPVGTVSVTASATGFQSSTQSVTVSAGTTTTQNFTLSIAVTTGAISGTVTDSSATPISGATVSYAGGSTTTSSTGAYTLANVPAGTVSVTASATGYVSSTQSVTVTAGTTTTQNFSLASSVGPPFSIQGAISPASTGTGSLVALNGPVPVLVQTARGSHSTGNNSATATFGAASGAGHAIVVFVRYGGTSTAGNSTTITDNQNTYTSVIATQWGVNPSDRWAQAFVAKNITGGTQLTITVHLAAASTHDIYLVALEYSGVDPVNPVNATAFGKGSGGSPSTANLSTTVGNTKLVATGWDANESYLSTSNGSGFTTNSSAGINSISGGSGWSNLTEDSTAATAGAWKATTTSTRAVTDWAIQLVALTPVSLQTATADSAGSYTFLNLNGGTYTVTPSKSGHTFTPSSQAVTINTSNVSGVNFTIQ